MIKKKFKVQDMHCSSCALTIDIDLEGVDGVSKSNTSYGKGEVEVELDPNKVSDKLILDTIKKSGYSAIPLER